MHARVFDTIFQTVFEANVLKASALIAVLRQCFECSIRLWPGSPRRVDRVTWVEHAMALAVSAFGRTKESQGISKGPAYPLGLSCWRRLSILFVSDRDLMFHASGEPHED